MTIARTSSSMLRGPAASVSQKVASPPPSSPSDAELLAEVGRDNLSALGTLFDRHHQRVHRVLARTGVSDTDADDLVQATFLELPKIARAFDGRDSCAAWLCGIAIRLSARRRRTVGRLLRTLASFASSSPTTHLVDPESEAASREELNIFAQALAGIAQKKRDAFVLIELEGFSAEEVARVLNTNAATVRTRLFHARSDLRAAMKREGGW